MNTISEQYFAELKKRIDALGEKPTEEELNIIASQVMAEINERARKRDVDAESLNEYDYLEMAAEAKTLKAKREYLTKGLEIAPDNIDLKRELMLIEKLTPVEKLKAIDKLIDEAAAEIERDNGFKEYAGMFWGVLETRPFMRLRMDRFLQMYQMGMFSQAINEGKDMLKLSTNDNLGVRYFLVFLYALREDGQAMERLIKKYEMEKSIAAMLAEAVLYYKRCDFDRAAVKLNEICKAVKGAIGVFHDLSGIDELYLPIEHEFDFYMMNSPQELLATIFDNAPVFQSMQGFFKWAYAAVKIKKSGKGIK